MRTINGVPIIIMAYLSGQVFFTIAVSPLFLNILTAEKMGFVVGTATYGLSIGIIISVILGILSSRTAMGLEIRSRGFKNIRTREDFEKMWRIQLYGCLDGVVAEPFWSGVVLSLLIAGFSLVGIPYIGSAALAIAGRWLLHVVVHALLPGGIHGEGGAGSLDFIGIGLMFMDVINSLCFLATGNIVAPIIIHTFAGPFSQLLGDKRRIAKRIGISLEEK